MSDQDNQNILTYAMDPERLYNQAPCGYITFSPDGTIIKVNETLCAWLGYSRHELINVMKFGQLLSKGGQIHYEMFFRPMLKISGSVKELSYDLLTKNGTNLHVLFGAVAFKDDGGELVVINGILTDNRDRKRYEQDLLYARKRAELEKRRLNNFFMQMPAGVCVLDGHEMVFELVNPLYQQLFEDRELLGKPLLDALPEVKGQPIWDVLTGVYKSGETYEGVDLLIPLRRTAAGIVEERYFNFIYQARYNEYDVIDGVLVFVIEVTDMVRARKELEQSYEEQQTMNEELTAINEELATTNDELYQTQASLRETVANFEASERELRDIKEKLEKELEVNKLIQQQKDGFIGMASHELKTPLTSLNAILQLANKKLKDSPDTFLANAMIKAGQQVKRMTAMINGFLNISRLESGKMMLDRTSFNISQLIADMIDDVKVTTHNPIFQVAICDGIVYADRDKIGSVITNFLTNAVKYSPGETEIRVACSLKGGDVEVSVKDSGMGVAHQDLERLFERYFRVESPETRNIAGFGIGLYLSAEIIKQHKGRIWAESEPGLGSTFYFSLPLSN